LTGKPLHTFPDHALGRLCLFCGRIGNGKWPAAVKLMELTFGLRQPIGDRPQRGRVDADPDMACETDFDVLGGIRGTQRGGGPVSHTPRPLAEQEGPARPAAPSVLSAM